MLYAFLVQHIIHFQCILDFFFYHPVNKVNVFRTIRTMQEKFELVKVVKDEINKFHHRTNRNTPQIGHVMGGYIIEAPILCRVISLPKSINRRFYQRREQRCLILKVAVKRSCGNTCALA